MRIILKKQSAARLIAGLNGVEGAKAFRDALVEKIERLRATEAQVDFGLLDDEGIGTVERIALEDGDRSVSGQIATYRKILKEPGDARISRLPHLEGAIVEWILKDVIKGWVFKRSDDGLKAWTVDDVHYDIGVNREASVQVGMSANVPMLIGETERHRIGRHSITVYSKSLPASVEEIMAEQGFLHETQDLHQEYEEARRRYVEILDQPNAQFRLAAGRYAGVNRKNHYGTNKLVIAAQHRCVNDETLVMRPARDAASRNHWDDRTSSHGKRRTPGGPRDIPDTAFNEMPTHFLHLVYDLDAHGYAWVPGSALEEYVYHPEQVEHLVLPDDHRELVDILTADGDILIDDVVEGKSGGTIVLLRGKPGLGKTLLAEVYAEKMRKILYRIQAGQLGTTPQEVAEGIADLYENAGRWDAVVLIDECDVYTRERGDDMEHNAVVASLLVTFERQTAITFLATNRADVDDAIISRCIAVVNFRSPDKEAARRIWRIQADTIGVEISDATITEIVEHHEGADGQRASGRDIRALLKLALRYNRARGRAVDTELLISLGAFKGL